MKELGGRKKTSIAALRKSKEDKDRPGGAKSVEKPDSSRRETFVVASGPIA